MTIEELKDYLFYNLDNEEMEEIIKYLTEVITISRELIVENENN